MFKVSKKKLIIFSFLLFLVVYLFLALKVLNNFPRKTDLAHRPDEFGATFSQKFAKELGLDWKETYIAILDDLKVKNLRLPSYWDEIEKEEGIYDFEDLDYMISEASDRNINLIVTLGQRQPRWPECHLPEWVSNDSDKDEKLLKLITAIVNRYKENSNITNWQIENEAFLGTFGVCPALDQEFLNKEIQLVKSLDSRPIIITASGEMSSWRKEVAVGDVFGATTYKIVYNSYFGFIKYPFPSGFYNLKARLAGAQPEKSLLIELQTEPWVPQGNMKDLTVKEINDSMSLDQFKGNLQYALNEKFEKIYVWGVEWWYWQKLYGNPEYWKIGQYIFN